MFAAAACAAPVDAGFLIGATTLEEFSPPLANIDTSAIVRGLTLVDIDGAADVTAANDINFTDPTGSYYLAWDSLGNEYLFTGTWTGPGNCTADKCISDLKPPRAVQAVPEPGIVMLLALAFGLLGFTVRRRDA